MAARDLRAAGTWSVRQPASIRTGNPVAAMARPGAFTLYRRTLKSDEFYADELINIFLLRPLAALVVWLVYPLRVTPNDVTIAAAYDNWLGTSGAIALA